MEGVDNADPSIPPSRGYDTQKCALRTAKANGERTPVRLAVRQTFRRWRPFAAVADRIWWPAKLRFYGRFWPAGQSEHFRVVTPTAEKVERLMAAARRGPAAMVTATPP